MCEYICIYRYIYVYIHIVLHYSELALFSLQVCQIISTHVCTLFFVCFKRWKVWMVDFLFLPTKFSRLCVQLSDFEPIQYIFVCI